MAGKREDGRRRSKGKISKIFKKSSWDTVVSRWVGGKACLGRRKMAQDDRKGRFQETKKERWDTAVLRWAGRKGMAGKQEDGRRQ